MFKKFLFLMATGLGLFNSNLSAKAILAKGNGSANYTFPTVMAAMHAAEAGDVILVNGNIHNERIVLKDQVNINFNGFSVSNDNGQEIIVDNGVAVKCNVTGLGKISSANTTTDAPIIKLSGGSTVYFDLEECVSQGGKIIDTNNADTVYFSAKSIVQVGGTAGGMFVSDKNCLVVVRNADIKTEGIGFMANGRDAVGLPARFIIENSTFYSKYGAFVQLTSGADVTVSDCRVKIDGVRAVVIMGGGIKKVTMKNTDIVSTHTSLNATYNAANEPVFYAVVADGDVRFYGVNTIRAAGASKPIGNASTIKVYGKLYVNQANDAGVVAPVEPITVNATI